MTNSKGTDAAVADGSSEKDDRLPRIRDGLVNFFKRTIDCGDSRDDAADPAARMGDGYVPVRGI